MSRVVLSQVTKKFGDVTALHAIDLEINEGEFLTLLGPSGCGKTTTLRLIAGFNQPTSGTILLGEEDVTNVLPQHRKIGMVFQDYALFPHMTIYENIAFGLRERGYDKERIPERVEELLELIHLSGVGERYPMEVSGGQQQRIAVARAVAYPPRVLLMDEPLGALDLKLRESMQFELRRIQQELKITAVYVTHDQTEAMNMSDRIVVMNEGVIEQMGSAEAIYNTPSSRFVADFVGQINLLPGRVVGDEGDWHMVDVLNTKVRVPKRNGAAQEGEITVAIRPEFLTAIPLEADANGMNTIEGKIVGRTFAGNLLKVYVDVAEGTQLVIEGRPRDNFEWDGARVQVAWQPGDALVLTR